MEVNPKQRESHLSNPSEKEYQQGSIALTILIIMSGSLLALLLVSAAVPVQMRFDADSLGVRADATVTKPDSIAQACASSCAEKVTLQLLQLFSAH